MAECSVILETVTPLFLGSADGVTPELRVASIRGALRFWLRALLGAHLGDDAEEVSKVESAVFGDTERQSAVALRLIPLSSVAPQALDFTLDSGKGYLLWATTRTQRTALPPVTTRFKLVLFERPFRHQDAIPALDYACGALWLLVNLGGLGMRSRRGLGSLQVQEVENWPNRLSPICWPGGSCVDFSRFLSDGIAGVQKGLALETSSSLAPPTSFDILHPRSSAVYVGCQERWSDWDAALEGVGAALRAFRSKRPPDHDGVLSVIKGIGKPDTVERAAFGLPLQFYYRGYHDGKAQQHPDWPRDKRQARQKTRYMASADVTPGPQNIERRASPLHFKVAWLSQGVLIPVITFFDSIFLPNPTLRIAPRDKRVQSVRVRAPGYSALRKFLEQPQWQEIFGGEP